MCGNFDAQWALGFCLAVVLDPMPVVDFRPRRAVPAKTSQQRDEPRQEQIEAVVSPGMHVCHDGPDSPPVGGFLQTARGMACNYCRRVAVFAHVLNYSSVLGCRTSLRF